ncbi:MAG: GDP-mannose 4,6-dehydratase, partial [Putridiphycobacter sp.]|nr:GDP-mannose 4,6-dehydratase [Putridiphycobacter sp.]
VCLRFGNVYGPGSLHKSSVVAKFIRLAMEGETLEIYGDGSQTRDFIYIDDLINAVMLASETQGIGGEVFQIASNKETTVGEMAEMLVSTLEDVGLDNIKLVNSQPRLGDVSRNYSDTSKARSRLNWKPAFELEEGLKNTVAYFMN